MAELHWPRWTPLPAERLEDDDADIFAAIRAGDIMVHHPYETFDGTAEKFIEAASRDPKVLCIKQSLYRTSGDSPFISKAYTPMMLRFYMLQAHYGSPLDITDEALQAAEKGYRKLMETNKILQKMTPDADNYDGSESDTDRAILALGDQAYAGMDDDFNTAVALASLNEVGSYVHKLANQQLAATEASPWVLERLKTVFNAFIFDIFGLLDDHDTAGDNGTVEGLMNLILDIRTAARAQKDWATSDKIRDGLAAAGITVKDGKEGTSWTKQV